MDYTQDEGLPPGTQRLENPTGEHLLLAPQPNADPNQPLNWSTWRKGLHMTILSFYALMVFAILCVAVPLWQDFNEEMNISYDILNDSYATNMAALSVGCVFFIPVALKFGRRPVYIATALIMLATCIWQARMQTAGDQIGTNFVMGIAGAVNEALFQVTVTDLFFVHQRGTMNGIYLIVVLAGNYLGPVAAGYVAVAQGWRCVFWYCTIFQAIVCIVMIFFLEETKYVAPATLNQSASPTQSVSEESSNQGSTSVREVKDAAVMVETNELTRNRKRRLVDIDTTIPMKSYRQRHSWYNIDTQTTTAKLSFWQHFWQPFQILVTLPGVMFAALQYGWAIAMLSILAVTQALIYPNPPYNFSPIGIGNMNLPPAIGAILGSAAGGPLIDYFIVQVAKRRAGIYEPESRLYLFIIPGLCMPFGALLYGLTIANGDPWIINAVGAGFIGFAIGGCGDIGLTYVQDSYQYILGDALTGIVFIRNVVATGLVFAVTPWMSNIGVYNMFVVIGVLSIVITLTVIPVIVWGRRWRASYGPKYRYFAARQY